MITNEQAAKMFEQPTIEAIPTDMKRIIIPAYGFAGAKDAQRPEWGPDGEFMEDVKGLTFTNPKDDCQQVLKQNDGCLICYDAPGRKEKIEKYLKEHPETFKTANFVQKFIDYMTTEVVNEGGKADLWDTDTNFAASLKDAPEKEDIRVGQVFSSVKKKEAVSAIYVNGGTEFQGPTATPQRADKEGAYLVKDNNGIRMVQKAEFLKAYTITNMPKTITNQKTLGE